MIRHSYQKHPAEDAICVCGQGRAEDVHNLMVWKKAPSGNWCSSIADGLHYRCRSVGSRWVPELGDNPTWRSLSEASTLVEAKKVCEEYRESRRPAKVQP